CLRARRCTSSLEDVGMKWICGISFSSRVTGKVVIAVTAFILCQCLTIELSAQNASAAFRNMETEWVKLRDPAPEVVGRHAGQTGQTVRIDGGILNFNAAFIAALREARMGEVGTPEADPSVASASTLAVDSGEGEEKSRSKASPEDPQDWRPDSFQPLPDHALDQDLGEGRRRNSFEWNGAFRQSMIFLCIEHAFRLATEGGTRA